jgi:hypothetical protein
LNVKGRKELTYEESHKEIDGVLYKLCSKCDQWFPCTQDHFYNNNINKSDGLYPYCKECTKNKSVQWQINNEERYRKYIKKRDSNESEERKISKRIVAQKQRESGYQAQYQKNNPDKMKKYSEKRFNKNHKIKTEEWYECRLYFDFRCAYCGKTWEKNKEETGKDLHKEHIIDCGKSDLSNCVPACQSCNSSKHTHSFNNWYNHKNPIYSRERYLKIYKWIKYDYKNYILPKDKNVLKLLKKAN